MQYGVLLFAVANKSKLDSSENTINRYQKFAISGNAFSHLNNLKIKKKRFYTVKELHIYELLKLLSKIPKKNRRSDFINNYINHFETFKIRTQRLKAQIFVMDCNKHSKFSLRTRIRKLFMCMSYFSSDFSNFVKNAGHTEKESFNHKFLDSSILGNEKLNSEIYRMTPSYAS